MEDILLLACEDVDDARSCLKAVEMVCWICFLFKSEHEYGIQFPRCSGYATTCKEGVLDAYTLSPKRYERQIGRLWSYSVDRQQRDGLTSGILSQESDGHAEAAAVAAALSKKKLLLLGGHLATRGYCLKALFRGMFTGQVLENN